MKKKNNSGYSPNRHNIGIYTVWIYQNRLSVGIQLPSSVKQNEIFAANKHSNLLELTENCVCFFKRAIQRSGHTSTFFVYSEKPVKHTRRNEIKKTHIFQIN